MQSTIYLNGKLLAAKDGKILATDRGLLLGDGLFETIRFDQGQAFRFEQHWLRLQQGSQLLNIPLPLTKHAALDYIQQLLAKNQLHQTAAVVRITLTRGSGERGLTPPSAPQPTLLIQCYQLPTTKPTSISVTHSSITVNEQSPLTAFKSLHYADRIVARQQAIAAGYEDALLYNSQGYLVSATSANVFIIIDDELITPPLRTGALPGIMRQYIMEQAEQHHSITVTEKLLCRKAVEQAQAAFTTNSIIRLIPISQLAHLSLKSHPITSTLARLIQH